MARLTIWQFLKILFYKCIRTIHFLYYQMRIINSVFHFLVLVVVEEPETRDAWWNEIRTEIRSHTRAMGCHAVIGYSEQTSIWLE